MNNIIEIENLVKIYHTPFLRKKIVGLNGLTLDIIKGEVFGLLGPNGAGKTTTIKLIVGLLRPTSGNIKVFGKSLGQSEKKIIGYLPENPYFYGYLTGFELLSLYAKLFGIKNRKIIDEVSEWVKISYALNQKISTYSKGMVQRIGIAQSILNDPQLLILDEPLSGLDPIGRKEIKDILLNLKNKGKTILFSSHILPDAEMICDRVGIIYKGKLINTGVLPEIADMEIKGFQVQCRDISDDIKKEYPEGIKRGKDIYIYIQKEDKLNDLLKRVIQSNGKIIGVVPMKKTLEEYFIEQVGEK